MRSRRTVALPLLMLALAGVCARVAQAQAALLLEEPYGFFGTLNPTGHTAIYFARICAASPIELRRCAPGEMGAVVARYQGMAGYDWVAIPLIPYLYSVENAYEVPERVNRAVVTRIRDEYHEAHLLSLGEALQPGDFWHGGWTELVGVAYERRIFAYRFNTTEAEDDALMVRLNAQANRSDFDLFYGNCSDFARVILDHYFPRTFNRSIFPDAGITTPKQITYKLLRYGRKHPEAGLRVFEIPQVKGYRHSSHSNKDVSESLITTGYAIPIVLLNPYLAGGLLVDYLVRGRFHLVPKQRTVLSPGTMGEFALTAPAAPDDNPASAPAQAARAADPGTDKDPSPGPATHGLREIPAEHEQ